jgi:phosphoglycerate dehydrogenase-like enzyme
MRKLAILDDYARASQRLADWSPVAAQCEITVFDRHLGLDEAIHALADFEILCTLRERMALPRQLIEALPKLRLIAATGEKHHRSLDLAAATEKGVLCCFTPGRGSGHNGAAELAWGLILALARHIPLEVNAMRSGGWQSTVGICLDGRTLGLLGLGRLGKAMTPVARAFGMKVIAWSQNLTPEVAATNGATWVSKDELFRQSDFLSVNVTLSDRTVGLVSAQEIALMKREAFLINTARGPIVVEDDLYEALVNRRIAGAALDVFDVEPLPDSSRFRALPNCILTPHQGYNVEELLKVFYEDTVENVLMYLQGAPIRLMKL